MKGFYVAFLRGINVGGHHKIPMAELKKILLNLGFENVLTLLNSGNIIFKSDAESTVKLENKISSHLEQTFGFYVLTIIRKAEFITELLSYNPFNAVILTKDTRLYCSFLKNNDNTNLKLPWSSPDQSFKIIGKRDRTIFSVLNLSVSNTPKATEVLEKFFGKDMTTRNWKTIERTGEKIKSTTGRK